MGRSSVLILFNVPIGDILSIGDYIYSTPTSGTPPVATGAPVYGGQVVAVDLINQTVTIDTTVLEPGPGGTSGVNPTLGDYIFFFKDGGYSKTS